MLRAAGIFLALGFELLVYCLVGVGLGYWMMTRWGASMFWALILGLAGLGVGMYRVYLIQKRLTGKEGKNGSDKT